MHSIVYAVAHDREDAFDLMNRHVSDKYTGGEFDGCTPTPKSDRYDEQFKQSAADVDGPFYLNSGRVDEVPDSETVFAFDVHQ